MSTIRANTITDAAGTGAPTLTNGAVLPAGSASAPAIFPTGDTNTGIFFPAADTIAFTKGGVEAMRIDSSGNLGLGVTPSAWSVGKALQIGSSGSQLLLADNTGTSYFGTNWYYDGSFRYKDNSFASSYNQQNNGIHVWNTAPSGTAGNAITFTQAMTLTASGNLGLGTSSPNAASILDAQSTTKGVRFPNMTTTQKNAIANVAGNVVFDTTLGKLCVNTGSAWQTITSV